MEKPGGVAMLAKLEIVEVSPWSTIAVGAAILLLMVGIVLLVVRFAKSRP